MGFNLVSAENAGGRAGVGIAAAWQRQNALYDEIVATHGYPKASPPIPHFPGFAKSLRSTVREKFSLSDSLQFGLEVGQQSHVPSGAAIIPAP